MDGGAWLAAVHGVANSQTWLSDFTFTFQFYALEKEMATHSSVLARRIPGTGSHRVGHDWSDVAARQFTRRHRGKEENIYIIKVSNWPKWELPWRRAWQPTPVILPGEFREQRNLPGYSPRGCKDSGMTEHLSLTKWELKCSRKERNGRRKWQDLLNY